MNANIKLAALYMKKRREAEEADDFLFYSLLEHAQSVRGNKKTKRVRKGNKENFRHLGEEALQRDYFREDPVEDEKTFRRRFRMSLRLYEKIKEGVMQHDDYFMQKRDRAGKLGYSTNQKITAALRMLAYAVPGDFLAEYLRVREATALESMKRFCRAIIEVYEEQYLRRPTKEDIEKLFKVGDQRGFPGMLGSLDCMHWEWKNCPKAYHGDYKGRSKKATIVLEAVASYDLWIWHAFFGAPGSLNDLNILARSPLFEQLIAGDGPSTAFEVNGHKYDMGYYLVDGIYPTYATFVKTISQPQKRRYEVYIIQMRQHYLD